MNIEKIKNKVKDNDYFFSNHADIERKVEDLRIIDIENAILNSDILENYPDTGRGESCLVVGFSEKIPIHAVCGWRGDKIVIITVYIPKPPKFIDPWTRRKNDENS